MKIVKYIFKSDTFLISLFYSLAYGIILFNDGLFIDDWCLYHVGRPAIMTMTSSYGKPLDGYYFTSILSFNTMLAPRLVIFFSFLFSALFLNRILKEISQISDGSRLSIVILFAIFPVNFARIILDLSMYALSYFAFFLGFWLFVNYLKTNNIILRFVSLIVFFLSFTTESFLVFYAVSFLLFILYKEKNSIRTAGDLMVRLSRYADFLVIVPAFWIMKTVFLKQSGIYATYNHITFGSIISSPLRSIGVFNESFIGVMNSAFGIFFSNISLSVIFGFAVLVFLSKTALAEMGSGKHDIKLFFLGIILFFTAVFPYLAVEHIPRFSDWDSRNQLLLPLGASFVLYYGLKLFCNRLKWGSEARLFSYALIIVLFISLNFSVYLDYQKDWFKQLSLVENFRSSRIMKDNSTFIFDDQAADMNALGRYYRFYEYTGLMKLAFNDETRFGIGLDAYNKMEWSRYFIDNRSLIDLPECNITAYRPKDPDFRVVIKPGSTDLSGMHKVLRVLYYKIFEPTKFKEAIAGIVKLEYVKL